MRNIDRRLHIDPLGGAAELGAAFGMPVLPQQQAAAAEQRAADHLIQRGVQQLPGFNELRPAMARIVQTTPGLSSDPETALAQAYQIAANEQQGHFWVRDQLNTIAQKDSVMAAQLAETLVKDAAFKKHTANMSPPERLNAAYFWLQSKQSQQAVSKASRVKPVRSSSGAVPNNAGGKGIDAHLNAAMKDL